MMARRHRMYPTLLLIILITAFSVANSQHSGGNNSKKNGREACSKVALKNGKIKLRSGGRVVKFSCNRDYVLVGESTSTCLLGEWTSESPVCATKGCPSIPSPPSGRFIASNGGAVMRLECNPGYRPSDSPMIYCVDRFDWNGTAPVCQASGVQQSATRCDFESDDLCGWVQDTRTDEFDWTWQNYGTPSFHLGTGPSFDHTLGQGKAGHYLFIESSSPRVLNDTARLFSPVYGPPESSTISNEGVCFTFWFHMYGSTTGQLNVYIKPESKKISELRPAFVRSGDLGDKWRQGYISLDRVTENFQVVIEGVRGTGYVGDSAIDDVQLTKGGECLAALKSMMADTVVPGGSTIQPSSTVPPNASCASRCSTSTDADNSNTTSWICGCSDDCLLKNSCCSDYAAFCLTGRTDTSTAKVTTDKDGREPTVSTTASPPATTTLTTTTISTTTSRPPTAASTSSTTAATTTSTTAATTTSEPISTTTFRPATSALSTTTSSVTQPVTLATSTSAATTTIIPSTIASSNVTMTSTSEPSSTTTQRPTTITTSSPTTRSSTTIPTVTTTVEPSTTTTVKQMTVPTDSFRPTVVRTTTTAATTVSTTTVTPPSRPTTSVLVTDDPPQDGLQGDDDQSGVAADEPSSSTVSQTSSPSWVTGAVVAAAIGMAVLLTVGVAAVVMRSRRNVETGGVNGRRRRPKLRSSQQDQLAEDSDVRYLRDEDDVQLDLTEATPQSAASSQRQFANFERL